MIKIKKESKEVLYPEEDIPVLYNKDLNYLKKLALLNSKQKVRLCTHKSIKSKLHEMFIVHTKKCYVRPHKHINKSESVLILEGEVDIILFEDNGKLKEIIELGDKKSKKKFYYRLDKPIYHMLIIKTKFLVFHEITIGPFRKRETVFPEWSPKKYNKKFILNIYKNKKFLFNA